MDDGKVEVQLKHPVAGLNTKATLSEQELEELRLLVLEKAQLLVVEGPNRDIPAFANEIYSHLSSLSATNPIMECSLYRRWRNLDNKEKGCVNMRKSGEVG